MINMQEEPAAELLEIRSLVAAFVEPHDLFLGLHPGAAAAGPSLRGCFIIIFKYMWEKRTYDVYR